MFKNSILLNCSGIYEFQSIKDSVPNINLKNLESINCYCDNEAESHIRSILNSIPSTGIHFIDSGNYHYLTYFFLEKISSYFNLIVFDHHTDMGEPVFGDILSCGGWIKKSIERFPYLQEVMIVGVKDELAAQVQACNFRKRVVIQRESELNTKNTFDFKQKLPVYISIDKDVLSPEEMTTNWDQGSMAVTSLYSDLSFIFSNFEVIGIDVCGEPDMNTKNLNVAVGKSDDFNMKLLQYIKSAG